MSLFEDLKAAAHALDPQFQVTDNEVKPVLSAIAHYIEHGDSFLQAASAGVDDVQHLLQPEPPPEQTAAADATTPSTSASSEEDLRRQISDLEAQLATRQATSQATTVSHETATPPSGPTAPVASPEEPV